MTVDMDSVVPVSRMEGEDTEETELLQAAYAEAASYIQRFKWCKSVEGGYFGVGVGGVVAVFLFRIVPNGINDEWLWVVTGDLPPAYMVTDQASTPAAALGVYCDLMEDWVRSVKAGSPLNDVFPVDVPPTSQNADRLATRLAFLREEVMPTLS